MKRTTYQVPEIRDENDNIIQDGTFGKHSAFSNATNDGAFDYILNNLEALHDNLNGSRIYVANKAALPATGDLSAMYIAEDTGKWYLWDGQKYIETDNARKIADEAIAARDAAKASQSAAKTSETNAKTSETNAAASKTAAATSASAAKTSENNAGTQANTAKAWATSTTSPDGAADTSSTTGKTQSAKSWAMYSKDRATASASSASAAAGSASAAKTSENNAASSKSAAATSATNAANSAKAAADSATAAANSAREQQADWNVTDSSSKAFIKNKPDVLLKSGGTATGTIIAPSFQTGNDASHYFQCRKFRGSGDADEYYHAIDFGYSGRDTVDFYEYGGVWNFYQSRRGTIETSTLVGAITASAGWDGLVKGQDITTYAKKSDLSSSVSTTSLTVSGETSVPTANAGNSSKAIANTEFVAKSLASLVNGAPAQLNTLNELAKALGNDANFSATITAELAKKLNSTEAESTYLPLSGGTLTGVVNGVTPTAGDDTTKLATTAWVQKLVAEALKTAKNEIYKQAKLDAHPVGSYYWSNDSTSPATLFGGTWEALPPGYTLIAQGSGSDSFGSFTYTAGQKYGERKHQLTTDELPSISGTVGGRTGTEGGLFERTATGVFTYQDPARGLTYETYGDGSESWVTYTTAKLSFGKNTPHANIQPSIAAYCWKRTA